MDASGEAHPILLRLRQRLDDIDTNLVELLALRQDVIREVIDFKATHDLGAVDRDREDAMMNRVEIMARERGLDARVARQVLRAVVDAFTLLETEVLGDPRG